jgi:hypothetical protein
MLRQVEADMMAFNAVMPRPKTKSIINSVWEDYLWFSKKDGVGYCTKCGGNFAPAKPFRHGAVLECPVCHKKLKARDTHRKTREDIRWVVVPYMNGDNLMTRRFRVLINWTDFRNPVIDVTELYRDVHDGAKWTGYMYWRTNDDRMMWMQFKEQRGGFYYSAYTGNFYTPHEETIYHPERLRLADTKYRYFPVMELLEPNSAWGIDNMMYHAETKPWIELLYKVGFAKLCRSAMESYGGVPVDESATDVIRLLKVTRKSYKLLLSIGDPTVEQLKLLQSYPVESLDDLSYLSFMSKAMYGGDAKAWNMIQTKKGRKTLRYLSTLEPKDVRDYFDYVSWLDKLGYDMTDEYYLFPSDFRTAHDTLSVAYQKYKDRAAKKQKQLQNKVLARLKKENDLPAFHLHSRGLFVTIAGSTEELAREGRELHHCVATYADKVANGETMILFIRKESDPDTPFYTMEFKDGMIQQLRGYANCEPTGEVLRFRDDFIRELDKNVKAA